MRGFELPENKIFDEIKNRKAKECDNTLNDKINQINQEITKTNQITKTRNNARSGASSWFMHSQ